MKVKVEFGIPASRIREVKWYDDILKMPRVVKFDGDYYEWIAYDKLVGEDTEYVLQYGKCPDQGYFLGLEVPVFEDMFKWQMDDTKCECGSAYDRHFANLAHSYWCPKWGKE